MGATSLFFSGQPAFYRQFRTASAPAQQTMWLLFRLRAFFLVCRSDLAPEGLVRGQDAFFRNIHELDVRRHALGQEIKHVGRNIQREPDLFEQLIWRRLAALVFHVIEILI
jgi:hypothetical protein